MNNNIYKPEGYTSETAWLYSVTHLAIDDGGLVFDEESGDTAFALVDAYGNVCSDYPVCNAFANAKRTVAEWLRNNTETVLKALAKAKKNERTWSRIPGGKIAWMWANK